MFLRLIQLWILLCATLSFAGWFLSWFRALNPVGYLLFYTVVIAAFFRIYPAFGWVKLNWRTELRKLGHRLRRLAPALFATIVFLNLIAGLIYDPSHGDSQSYRIPRVFHWLWENQWHWIHTGDVRMNVVAPGIEWLWAPGFLILPGIRWLFYVNMVSFIFLPGLLFGFFRQLGVRKGLAWWWMWLLSAGYGYAFQAGGIATDSYAVVFSLAAVYFALRARSRQNITDLWISVLAAALLTSVKQTNILLLPLWFIPFALNYKLLFSRPVVTSVFLAIAIGASSLPISIINARETGTWQGFKGADAARITPKYPLWGVIGNTFALTMQNLLPPVFPQATQWNAAMAKFRATDFGQNFEGFERFGHLYRAPNDESGGLGLLLSLLIIRALLRGRSVYRYRSGLAARNNLLRGTFLWLPWVLLLIFMAKVGVYTNARYLAPMYPFLILPILLRSPNEYRSGLWRTCVYITLGVTISLLIISRQRPIFPVQTICSLGQKYWPQKTFFAKAQRAYEYSQAQDKLRKTVGGSIPPDERVAGYMTEVGLLETGLWLPYGVRRVHRFAPTDPPDYLRSKGVRYLILEQPVLIYSQTFTIENWLERYHAELVAAYPMNRVSPEAPPETVYLVKLRE